MAAVHIYIGNYILSSMDLLLFGIFASKVKCVTTSRAHS